MINYLPIKNIILNKSNFLYKTNIFLSKDKENKQLKNNKNSILPINKQLINIKLKKSTKSVDLFVWKRYHLVVKNNMNGESK